MKTRAKKIVITIILLACAFVVADYCELLMVLNKDGARGVKYTFKLLDQNDGKPLAGVAMKAICGNREFRCYYSGQATPKGGISGYIMIPWG